MGKQTKYNRLEKKFDRYDSELYAMKKQNRLAPGSIDPKHLERQSKRLGRMAFKLNQAHMGIGGDGDRASYDDVGQQGYEEVVKLQDKLNKK